MTQLMPTAVINYSLGVTAFSGVGGEVTCWVRLFWWGFTTLELISILPSIFTRLDLLPISPSSLHLFLIQFY